MPRASTSLESRPPLDRDATHYGQTPFPVRLNDHDFAVHHSRSPLWEGPPEIWLVRNNESVSRLRDFGHLGAKPHRLRLGDGLHTLPAVAEFGHLGDGTQPSKPHRFQCAVRGAAEHRVDRNPQLPDRIAHGRRAATAGFIELSLQLGVVGIRGELACRITST